MILPVRSLVWILLSLPAQGALAQAAEPLKVGFISTFSGGGALLGQHMYDGFMLGLGERGGKLGGVPAQIIKGDDQLKPDIALKLARDMIQGEKVKFLVGFAFSNVLLAASKVGIDSETFVISANAGPADLAGKNCSPYFFSVAYQNEMNDESAGTYLTEAGVKKVYLMAPNYVAGREALGGFKRTFKGEIIGEVYTALDQVDYSAELSQMRAAKPDAAYIFYPGGLGVMFVKQFYQAGLRDSIPLLSKATVDLTNLTAQGEAAVGSKEVTHWNWDFDNPASKKFVTDYMKKYGYKPSIFSEGGYDSAQVLDRAISATNGNLTDNEGLRRALERAEIESPRGAFKFNTNHFPIHNSYLLEVTKDEADKPSLVTRKVIKEASSDSYASQCAMNR